MWQNKAIYEYICMICYEKNLHANTKSMMRWHDTKMTWQTNMYIAYCIEKSSMNTNIKLNPDSKKKKRKEKGINLISLAISLPSSQLWDSTRWNYTA